MWRYYLVFIKNLFYYNSVKSLFLLAAVVAFWFAGSFEDEVYNYRLLTENCISSGSDTTYLYLVEKIEGSSVKYDLIESKVELNIINGYLEVYSYHVVNILLWIFFGFTTLIVFFISFLDDDLGWDLYLVKKETLLEFIECELEGGKFYYTAFGRLLVVKENQLRYKLSYDYLRSLSIYRLSDIKLCPKFKTKKQSRVDKLNSLGI